MATDTPIMIEAKRPDGTVLYRHALHPHLIGQMMQIIMRYHYGAPDTSKIVGTYQITINMPDGI